jgi:hypothetical protein
VCYWPALVYRDYALLVWDGPTGLSLMIKAMPSVAVWGEGGEGAGSTCSWLDTCSIALGRNDVYFVSEKKDGGDNQDASTPVTSPIVDHKQKRVMEVSVALEALESMRKLNLEMEFANASSRTATISRYPVQHDDCTFCQRLKLQQ